MSLLIKKYGGSSVSTPEQIKSISQKVKSHVDNGNKVLIVISAMGKTTNELNQLALKVSQTPHRRELDMLLSTGERVSMALMSMALNDIGCRAISFTGSQAGVFTDNSHNNARILNIKPIRVEEELTKNNVVVLAGFQGVDPITKEITTLGRGGTDTTAVAFAIYFKTNICEMCKDVDGIQTADPKLVTNIKPLPKLNYKELLEMTYWGAKVLHYRAVELAKRYGVELKISLAHKESQGTLISEESGMYEQEQVLAINALDRVCQLIVKSESLGSALSELHKFLKENQISWPQILDSQRSNAGWNFFITGSEEGMENLEQLLSLNGNMEMASKDFSTVTATCHGSVASNLAQRFCQILEKENIEPLKLITSPLSLTGIVKREQKEEAVKSLHRLIS